MRNVSTSVAVAGLAMLYTVYMQPLRPRLVDAERGNIGRMALLTPDQLTAGLESLDGWTAQGKTIRKEYKFQDFPEAVLFVSALVPGAEEADHHPDIEIHYKRVVLTYSTHSEGGVTAKDLDGAAMADEIAGSLQHLEEFGDG
jgi:4a-hydroxytetrahydrobiopterin dehydratase